MNKLLNKAFGRLMQKICKWTIARASRSSRLGGIVWVYFPNVGKIFRMRISSFKMGFIYARFVNPDGYHLSHVDEDYGQIDNDIMIDKKTGLPVDKD